VAVTTTARGVVGYDETGDPGDPPLVLIQGFSAQRIGWPPGFVGALADRGFRVLRYDNRDVGESARFPEGGYGIADLADDAAAFLDERGIGSAHIVGQSMGGMIAQLLATRHPARVRSLGLLYTAANVHHFVDAEDVIAERSETAIPTTREEFVPAYVASEARCASPAYPQDVPWLTELGGLAWDAGYDPAGIDRQLAALLAYPDQSEADRAIAVPTVIIAGDGDRLISFRASEELHAAIPGSTLHIMPGMGHEVPRPLWPELAWLLAENAALAGGAGDAGAAGTAPA
jgi:pimeloyl-ACP methyl ester carboxylesterase